MPQRAVAYRHDSGTNTAVTMFGYTADQCGPNPATRSAHIATMGILRTIKYVMASVRDEKISSNVTEKPGELLFGVGYAQQGLNTCCSTQTTILVIAPSVLLGLMVELAESEKLQRNTNTSACQMRASRAR